MGSWEGLGGNWEGLGGNWEVLIRSWEGLITSWEGNRESWEGLRGNWEALRGSWEGFRWSWKGLRWSSDGCIGNKVLKKTENRGLRPQWVGTLRNCMGSCIVIVSLLISVYLAETNNLLLFLKKHDRPMD